MKQKRDVLRIGIEIVDGRGGVDSIDLEHARVFCLVNAKLEDG